MDDSIGRLGTTAPTKFRPLGSEVMFVNVNVNVDVNGDFGGGSRVTRNEQRATSDRTDNFDLNFHKT